jgi:glyceraldehyde 3-phosphate dehydrogenase
MTNNHKDWNERIAVAEEMVPLIGRLHRNNNVVVSVFGRLLVNVSDIDIIKSHRYARHITTKELPLQDTLAILRELVDLDLGSASIDLGQLAYNFENSGKDDLRAFLEESLADVIGAGSPPSTPMSCSTASEESVACWPASSSPVRHSMTVSVCVRSWCARTPRMI